MKTIAFYLLTLTALMSCTSAPPTQEQINTAEYGSVPTAYTSEVNTFLDSVLVDPRSKQVTYMDTPKKGSWPSKGSNQFGYFVCANVNAKNGFGGYAGVNQYFFGFSNGKLIKVYGKSQLTNRHATDCYCKQEHWNGYSICE